MTYTLVQRFTFEATHAVTLHGIPEKPHAHRFTLKVWIQGPIQDEGVVWDFIDLKKRLQKIIGRVEGRDLAEVIQPPTVERLGTLLWDQIQTVLPPMLTLIQLELWETPEQGVVITP